MFLRSDIQADNSLELKEIIEWVEGNTKAMELFNRFGNKSIHSYIPFYFVFFLGVGIGEIISLRINHSTAINTKEGGILFY